MAQSSAEKGVFPQTTKFIEAIELIRNISPNKLQSILIRVLDNLQKSNDLLDTTTGAKPFSKEEQDTLCEKLSIDATQLSSLINAIAFIFDLSAQHNLKPNKLKSELSRVNMQDQHSEVFEKVWTENGQEFIEMLKELCFAPKVLKEVNWSLQMSVASQNSARLREPRAIFEIKTGNPQLVENYEMDRTGKSVDGKNERSEDGSHLEEVNDGSSRQAQQDSFFMELSLEELTHLFNDLEKIQQQIDALC